MKRTRKIWIIFFIITTASVLYSQPYHYYPVVSSIKIQDADSVEIFKIMYHNLQTGEDKVFLNECTSDDIIVDPTFSWVVVGDQKYGYFIYNFNDTTKYSNVSFKVIPEVICYSKIKEKIYIMGNIRYGQKEWPSRGLNIINALTLKSDTTIILQKSNFDFITPFFSTDESKLYVLIRDSTMVDYSDKSKIIELSTITNSIIAEKELKTIGYPGARLYGLKRGRNGKGIISSVIEPRRNIYYQIYDFEKGISSAFINSTIYSKAYILGEDCRYLVLVEQKRGLIDNKDPIEVPNGIVKIYDSQTGQLIKTLNYPEETPILFFDSFPNDIYPLGVKVNGVVTKFSIDSLKAVQKNNMKKN